MKYVNFSWDCEATETFRWISRKSSKGYGFNGQTDPKGFRWFKIAPPGRVFGQKDLKQAEARCVAYFAMAKNLLKVFQDPNINLYISMAALSGKEVKKDTPEYTLWKANIHAGNYDEGPFKMAWDNGISVHQAREFQEMYHGANPEIRLWHKATEKELIEKWTLKIPYFNRSRTFYEAAGFYSVYHTITDHQRKDAIAWRPQTLVPQIITSGMRAARRVLSPEVWFHQHTHDAVLWSCPPEIFAESAAILDKALCVEIPINGMVMVIPRETTIGYSVGDMMLYENHVPTMSEWEKWVNKKVKDRRKAILGGIYGAHLKG